MYMFMCMYMYMYTHIYIYIHTPVCVCTYGVLIMAHLIAFGQAAKEQQEAILAAATEGPASLISGRKAARAEKKAESMLNTFWRLHAGFSKCSLGLSLSLSRFLYTH